MTFPGAEPFFLPGDSIGCLLIHGFTGTLKEMRSMGEYPADKGHSALGVRLVDHATRTEDLLRTRCQEWIDSIEDICHILREFANTIFLIGLSIWGQQTNNCSGLRTADM